MVESNLRDINRGLDGARSEIRATPAPTAQARRAEPARLQPETRGARSDGIQRGNLHRLSRDIRERATPHDRSHIVEDKLTEERRNLDAAREDRQ